MFDPELKYCPKCNDEYRADIEKCHACEGALLTGLEMVARDKDRQGDQVVRSGEFLPEDELVAVRHGPLAEMRVYEELLNSVRICTLLAGDEKSCGKGCCGGNFDLVVRREEAQDALAIIEAEIRRTSVIDAGEHRGNGEVFDPMAAANICPACGHRFSGGMECPDCGLCF